MTCVHLDIATCTNDRAVKRFGGSRPSPGICDICPDYDGPIRGAGDAIAKPLKAMGIKGCGGCGRRRGALNTMFPAKPGANP